MVAQAKGGDETWEGVAGWAGYMDRSRQVRGSLYKAGRRPWPVRMKKKIDDSWAGRKTLDRMMV